MEKVIIRTLKGKIKVRKIRRHYVEHINSFARYVYLYHIDIASIMSTISNS